MAKAARKRPPKSPGVAALKRGRVDMATRCQAIAKALANEAGVKKVTYHERGLTGRASGKDKRIWVPKPTTRRRLYVFAHECAHVVMEHNRGRGRAEHVKEYHCELWAHDALRRHDVPVPKKETENGKKYVAHKIHQAVRRGAKSIDAEALEWCKAYHSPTVKKWLRDNPQPAITKQKPTRAVKKKRQSKEENKVTALITQGADVGKLVRGLEKDDLTKWFNLYLGVEVDPESNTFRAKLQDVQRFLGFFFETTRGYNCDDWTRAVTKSFIKWIAKQPARNQQGDETDRLLSASTQIRVLDTLKHASRWIHRHRPFLAGVPFGKGDGIETKRTGWKGFTDLQVTRLMSAAEQLMHMSRRRNQDPVRDYAILRVLLHTALRVNEFVELQLSQYRGKHLVNIPRKGGVVTEKIFLDQSAREALDRYLEESRGDKRGSLFLSKNGKQLTQQAVYVVLQRIAAQANSRLPEAEQIDIHPHLLRHTQLRKVAREKGIEAAMELSGHKSERYIWRYIQASEDEMEEALTDLWD